MGSQMFSIWSFDEDLMKILSLESFDLQCSFL